MALPPSLPPTTPTGLTEAETSMLAQDNISVTIRNGKRTVEGYNHNGEKVVIETTIVTSSSEQNKGYRSQAMSVCDNLTASERQRAARQMKDVDRLSQVEIAKKLGVSQKTISNDLKSE